MKTVFHSSFACIAAIFLLLQGMRLTVGIDDITSLAKNLLPPEFSSTNFTIDDIKKIFQEKCERASGNGTTVIYKGIDEDATTLLGCLSKIVNITAIQQEMEVARPIGELDTVFNKYCGMAPEAERCIRNFNGKVQQCLTVKEKIQNAVLMRIIDGLLRFVCQKGGDQIALFVAEEGPECFEANKDNIAQCANASFSQELPQNFSLTYLLSKPDLILEPEQCHDFQQFKICTLNHLEKCREITPANIAESVFRFIMNETNCTHTTEAKARGNSYLQDSRSGSDRSRASILILTINFLIFFHLFDW